MEPSEESKEFTPEEIERYKLLRGIFCNLMLPIAEAYLPDIANDEVLLVNQEKPTEEPKFLRLKRARAADIYESFNAKDVADLLREEPIPGTAIICFNAYHGFKALLVARHGVKPLEA